MHIIILLYIYLHSYWKIGNGIKHLKHVQISAFIYLLHVFIFTKYWKGIQKTQVTVTQESQIQKNSMVTDNKYTLLLMISAIENLG